MYLLEKQLRNYLEGLDSYELIIRQDKARQVELLVKICRDYRLGKRLLERKEEFRVLEKE